MSCVCRLIRDFERQARADNMSVQELNRRKKELVQELNGFIGLKKAYSAQSAQRGELLNQSHLTPTRGPTQEETQGELMKIVLVLPSSSASKDDMLKKILMNGRFWSVRSNSFPQFH